jgi:hypothetical protein
MICLKCGLILERSKGAFTIVLASLLEAKSKIYFNQDIHFSRPLHRIILANSLHYVKGQVVLMELLKSKLKQDGRVIIEYDIARGNQYVPFPVTFSGVKDQSDKAGFTKVVKLATIPSHYHRMYSALFL